jgi:hypothetical protein
MLSVRKYRPQGDDNQILPRPPAFARFASYGSASHPAANAGF